MPTQEAPSEAQVTDKVVKEAPSTASAEATTATKIDGTPEVSDATENQTDASVSADEGDISEFLPQKDKEEPSVGMQKRIDKLTAKLREAEERLAEIEAEKKGEAPKKPRYTKEQLKGAMAKAVAEQDHELMMDILEYQVEQAKEDLRNEYLGEKTQAVKAQEQAMAEWQEVVKMYGHFANPKAEVYQGSSKELNVQDENSKLRRLAEELWKSGRYNYNGGRKAAMTDALAMIMQKRTNTTENPESLRLKKQLEREKMKTAPVSGDSEGGSSETVERTGLLNPNDKLAQYVEERRAQRAKADKGT